MFLASGHYVDPATPLLPEEKVDHQEVERIVELADARVGLANAHGIPDIEGPRSADLEWFLKAGEDREKRPLIFGSKSMEKLAELGDTNAWIKWLRETFEQNEAEMGALLQKELKRTRPSDEEARKPKWRLRFRIYSHSHSIRQKALNMLAEATDFIRVTATGKKVFSDARKDEMIFEITLPSGVAAGALWHLGWGISRAFVTALRCDRWNTGRCASNGGAAQARCDSAPPS